MSRPAVVFDGVWKRFRRGERHDSLRDLIPSLVRRATGTARKPIDDSRDFWALQNVSFDVQPGEALGIVGPNGAGKSTTLKLLTKILRPTRGTCTVRGRAGALIEVSAGFHPDLTGRENVFLQGAIMGMKRHEISAKLDAIVEFAGISDFIDTQVKRYSSGMNARLGFSIAAHLDPEVLIIDEVLSVGDMAFQERCVNRMIEFKRSGVAIVFVSHNLQAVSMLCDRALFICKETLALGETARVMQAYTERAHEATARIDCDFVIADARLQTPLGRTDGLPPGTPMVLSVKFKARSDARNVTLVIAVHRSTDSLVVYDANFTADEIGVDAIDSGDELSVDVAFDANVVRGMYYVECFIVDTATLRFLSPRAPVARFSIDELRTRTGVADMSASVSVRCQRTPDVPMPALETH